jgi:hypothetical protein
MPSYIYGCGSFQDECPGILVFWPFGRGYEPRLDNYSRTFGTLSSNYRRGKPELWSVYAMVQPLGLGYRWVVACARDQLIRTFARCGASKTEKPRRRCARLHVRDAESGRLRASGRSPREEGIIVRACQAISMVVAHSRTFVLEF